MSRMFSEMIVGVKMRVLEVFLLAALGCSLAEGQLVSKCELKDELMKAIGGLPQHARPKGVTVDNLVAKIVCHVELKSGFNTSAVNELTVKEEDDDRRRKRDTTHRGSVGLEHQVHSSTIQPHTERQRPKPPNHLEHKDPLTTIRPHTRERRNAKQPPPVTRPPPPPPNRPTTQLKHPHEKQEVWTLYGLFQLSDHLVCNGTSESLNICGMDCSNLLNNITSDDISCLMKVFTDAASASAHREELETMVDLIYQKECKDKKASKYFAGCP